MKTAHKMFEDLGYKKIETIDEGDCILYQNENISIYIFPKKREIRKEYNGICLICNITIAELKAINKKLEELGLLDITSILERKK